MIVKACLVIFIIVFSELVAACDCKITDPNEAFSTSKFVAYGLIKEVKANASDNPFQALAGNFQALEVFKGSASSIITIFGGARSSSASCLLKLEPGEYVIYTNEETASIHLCSFSENVTYHSLAKKNSLLESLRALSRANNKI